MDGRLSRVGRQARDGNGKARGNGQDPSSLESDGQEKLCGELQDVRTVNRHRWVRRVASGERVKRGQGTRHNDPVTSEEGMPLGVADLRRSSRRGRRESAQATV